MLQALPYVVLNCNTIGRHWGNFSLINLAAADLLECKQCNVPIKSLAVPIFSAPIRYISDKSNT